MRAIWEGGLLKMRRKQVGLRMEALAQKIGCTRAAISIWESGKSVPGGDLLVLLSEVLKQEPKSFFRLEIEDEPCEPMLTLF